MRFGVGAALVCALLSSCKSRSFESSPKLFNSVQISNDKYTQVVKLVYERNGSKYASSAFLLGPRLVVTAGHALADGAKNFVLRLDDETTLQPVVAPGGIFLSHKQKFSKYKYKNEEFNLDWDVGAILFSEDLKTPNNQPLPYFKLGAWPLPSKSSLEMVAVGMNPVDSSFENIKKFFAKFSVLSPHSMNIIYDMSVAGTPYSAAGDSGAPLFSRDLVFGTHSGLYTKGNNILFGYAASFFYPEGQDLWKSMWKKGVTQIARALAVSSYLRCLAFQNAEARKWLPIHFSIDSNAEVTALVLNTEDWVSTPVFDSNSFPSPLVMQSKPWLQTNQKSTKFRVAKFIGKQCKTVDERVANFSNAQALQDIETYPQADLSQVGVFVKGNFFTNLNY